MDSSSWNFEDDFKDTQPKSEAQSQKIESCSSTSEENEESWSNTPSQAIASTQFEPVKNVLKKENSSSPIFHAKKRPTPVGSPVFLSQTLISTNLNSSKRSRRTLDFECLQSQNIESTSTPELSTKKDTENSDSRESNKISSVPTSSQQSAQLIQQLDPSFREKLLKSDTKVPKAKKNGLEESLNKALKQLASDRILNQHLPSKVLKDKQDSLSAKILLIEEVFDVIIVTCQNCKMDNKISQEFDLVFRKEDPACPRDDENFVAGSDIIIHGSVSSFTDSRGRMVIGNVAKIDVIPNSSKLSKNSAGEFELVSKIVFE